MIHPLSFLFSAIYHVDPPSRSNPPMKGIFQYRSTTIPTLFTLYAPLQPLSSITIQDPHPAVQDVHPFSLYSTTLSPPPYLSPCPSSRAVVAPLSISSPSHFGRRLANTQRMRNPIRRLRPPIPLSPSRFSSIPRRNLR